MFLKCNRPDEEVTLAKLEESSHNPQLLRVTKVRREVIIEGTYSDNLDDPTTDWLEYEFYCKPGDVTRRPCVISPYHYRLDWLMWFQGFQPYRPDSWFTAFAAKLLMNDPDVTSLLEHNPFQDKDPPKYIRATYYIYTFTAKSSFAAQNGQWWKRRKDRAFMHPVNLEKLAQMQQRLFRSLQKQRRVFTPEMIDG